MNILIAVPWDQATGGVTHVAASLAAELRLRGHQVLFQFPVESGFRVTSHISARGFPSIRCRLRDFPPAGSKWRAHVSWYSAVVTALPQLLLHAFARRIDVVNIHYPGAQSALLVDLARVLGVPLVVSAHGSDLLTDSGPNMARGVIRQLEAADSVVVPSQNFLASVVAAYPWVKPKIRWIYNGYDAAEIAAAVRPRGANHQQVIVLCIAALTRKKGIDVLLRAFHRSTDPQLRLRIVGDGPLRHEFEALSAALGLSERVSFLGARDRKEVLEEIVNCDFTVMPSRHASESFGIAAVEAMALARPVVASAIGGLQELVAHGETGLLVQPDDPAALAHALDALAGDAAMREKFGTAGRFRAQRFTTRATADAYEAHFSKLIAASK